MFDDKICGFYSSPESWYVSYIFGEKHRIIRIFGSATFAAIFLPSAHRFLLRSFSTHVLKFRNRPLLLPTKTIPCAALGFIGGELEHYAAGVAYTDTFQCGRPLEVPLWTFRSLLPACLFFVHPIFAQRILVGEVKGSDVAMAQLEKRRFRRWPFFSIYEGENASCWSYGYQRFLQDGYYPAQPS